MNEDPLTGSGSAPDGSNRRLINVYIDPSWGTPGTPSYETIRSATEEAINGVMRIGGWNNAGDTGDTTCTPNPAKTGYYLQIVDQSVGTDLRDDAKITCILEPLI